MRASWEDAAVAVGKYDASSWKYKATRALETYACRRCNHVVVLCEGLKRELTGRGIPAEHLTVIPNGVDLEQFQPSQHDPAVAARWGVTGKRIVGFIGSFFHWEGLDVLIDALSILRRDRHDVVLLLVGGGDRADQLKEQVSRLGLGDAVVFTGAVPPSQVQSMYGIIDVLAYPRHLTRLTDLVTPLKPLEAMAMAKAVVASNVGGHRELIRDNETGLLFTPGDPHALAASLARLIDDDSLRQRLQATGHAWVGRERSWSQTTRRYDEVYERLAVGVDSHTPVLEPELECEQRE
jgi:PEP-CTERM/exosortase A-associated glycosyltransferase